MNLLTRLWNFEVLGKKFSALLSRLQLWNFSRRPVKANRTTNAKFRGEFIISYHETR